MLHPHKRAGNGLGKSDDLHAGKMLIRKLIKAFTMAPSSKLGALSPVLHWKTFASANLRHFYDGLPCESGVFEVSVGGLPRKKCVKSFCQWQELLFPAPADKAASHQNIQCSSSSLFFPERLCRWAPAVELLAHFVQ